MNWVSLVFTVILASRLPAMNYTLHLSAVPREELNQAYMTIEGDNWEQAFIEDFKVPKMAHRRVTELKNQLAMITNPSKEIINKIAACEKILKVFRG